jgi:hypothetical protein
VDFEQHAVFWTERSVSEIDLFPSSGREVESHLLNWWLLKKGSAPWECFVRWPHKHRLPCNEQSPDEDNLLPAGDEIISARTCKSCCTTSSEESDRVRSNTGNSSSTCLNICKENHKNCYRLVAKVDDTKTETKKHYVIHVLN